MMHKLRALPELTLLIGLSVIGFSFFIFTNPKNLPPAALMIGFLLLLAMVYAGVRLVFRLLGLKQRLKIGHYNALLVCLTALPVIAIALQSLGQLTLRDGITLLLLFVGGYFYISRLSSRHIENK